MGETRNTARIASSYGFLIDHRLGFHAFHPSASCRGKENVEERRTQRDRKKDRREREIEREGNILLIRGRPAFPPLVPPQIHESAPERTQHRRAHNQDSIAIVGSHGSFGTLRFSAFCETVRDTGVCR